MSLSADGKPKMESKARKRYPKDKEALAVLKEARRRKGEDSYNGDSKESIIELMINEGGNATARILHGKLNGKAKGQGREKKTAKDREEAVKLWGKYLSQYLKWHPLKKKAEEEDAEPSAVRPMPYGLALRLPKMGPRWPVGRPVVPYGPRLKECRPPSACYACAIRRAGRCRVPYAERLSGPYRTDRRAEPSAVKPSGGRSSAKPSARDRSAKPSAVKPSAVSKRRAVRR